MICTIFSEYKNTHIYSGNNKWEIGDIYIILVTIICCLKIKTIRHKRTGGGGGVGENQQKNSNSLML
jgi:hypothetical protein